jgi:diguanylate cyclase (GGDEF)-like protein
VGQQSITARAFIDATAIFVGQLVDAPNVHRGLQRETSMRSGLWQPVMRHGQTVAVLAVFWDRPIERLAPGLAELAALLASEAATTIERADLMHRLEAVARTDDLTGLPNRRAWDEELPKELLRAQRGRHPLCVAMLDLDRFKDYNDQHGHQAGDRVLKQAAGAWGERLRGTDTLARYGGEEFTLILPGCDMDEALRVAEELRAATPAEQTVSVGVARWDGEETPDELLARADAALYVAKSAGRDRAVAAT